jgi:hypothetical protein
VILPTPEPEPTENIPVIITSTEEQAAEKPVIEKIKNHVEESNNEKRIKVPVPEPEQIETPVAIVAVESELEIETQLLVASVNTEPEQKEPEQPTSREENHPRFNLLQKFLKKLRPTKRP